MGIFWEKKNKEDGKKSRFLLEIPNEGGRFSIEFVRYFLNAVLLNLSGQNLMQIYGQISHFHHGGDCHAHAKNRIRFAIKCKSSGFSI